MKQCTECRELKALTDFFNETKGKYGKKGKCKSCITGYKASNRLRDSQQMQTHNLQLKRSAFNLIGSCQCALCPETKLDRLNVDHIHRDGVRLRKAGRHGKGVSFYRLILRMTLAERRRLRVLCVHCNVLATHYTDAVIRMMHLARAQGVRYCPGCERVKSPSEFPKDAGTFDGLRVKCRECVAVYQQEYRQRGQSKRAA